MWHHVQSDNVSDFSKVKGSLKWNNLIFYFLKITIYILIHCLHHMKDLNLLLKLTTSYISSSHALFCDVLYEGNGFLIPFWVACLCFSPSDLRVMGRCLLSPVKIDDYIKSSGKLLLLFFNFSLYFSSVAILLGRKHIK